MATEFRDSLKPIVWTIAGSDCSGGAGIQADLHTIQALGGYGCSILTMVTAQNLTEMRTVYPIPPELLTQQIDVLKDDLTPQAIKIGALGNVDTISTLIPYLKNCSSWKVLDPVINSSSQHQLLENTAVTALLEKLLPLIDVLTPNVLEASLLTGVNIQTYEDMITAGKKLLDLGGKNIVIKGGHLSSQYAVDLWINSEQSAWLVSKRFPLNLNHGSGCTFSSAIATALALGYGLKDALVIAKMYLNQGHCELMKQPKPVPAIIHRGWPTEPEYLPRWCVHSDEIDFNYNFPKLVPATIGVYPVVDNLERLNFLVKQGFNTIQLRIKHKTGYELEQEIATGIKVAKTGNINLFINDYWELAIKYGAFGVHLGQEDASVTALTAISQSNLYLGISSHSYWEVARMHQIAPSYASIGPIFPTKSKIMPFPPQGIDGLKKWRQLIRLPLVAIGGINNENIEEIKACGVEGIAMISAITQNSLPL